MSEEPLIFDHTTGEVRRGRLTLTFGDADALIAAKRDLARAIETRENANAATLRAEAERDRYRAVLAALVPTLPEELSSPLCKCGLCAAYRAALERARNALKVLA